LADEDIQQDTPLLFARKQVADQLGVSEKTISRRIAKDELQQIRIG